jgi:NAD-dependent deacetylase
MRVAILTGAGISQESGIATFRGLQGLWEGHRLEDVASPEGFARQPDLVWEFYNQRRRQLLQPEIQPNAAHRAIAQFEQALEPEDFLLITQNVDNLHERAGSRRLIHMHGELLKARCLDTGEVFPWSGDLNRETPDPRDAQRRGRLRPHIVWFGEMPLGLEEIERHLQSCDLFVAVGTSGVVYPAAGFVRWTPHTCRRVEINLEATAAESQFDEILRGPATQVVPDFLHRILHQGLFPKLRP